MPSRADAPSSQLGAQLPGWTLEEQLWGRRLGKRLELVAGVDEAGRGALAGPVVAAAVILEPRKSYPYRDSKQLSAAARTEFALRVREEAIACAVGIASALEVDTLNVLGATKLAARRAVAALAPAADGLVTDYLRLGTGLPEVAVARGDTLSFQVAAASILAKTTRDALMCELDDVHPGYGFAKHKGYGAPQHLRALERLGACSEHRRNFAPVARLALFGGQGAAD